MGSDLLESICQCHSTTVHAWAIKATGEILAHESAKFAKCLCLYWRCGITDVLKEFLPARIMFNAEELAPTWCEFVRVPETTPTSEQKNQDLYVT
jgi:hypothetical protein